MIAKLFNSRAGRRACTWALLAALAGAAAAQDEAPGQAQIDFANGLFSRGFYADAAAEYREYLEQHPDGVQALTALNRLGECEYAARNYEAALDAFDQLLAKGPEGPLAQRTQLSRGEVLVFLGRPQEALKALTPLTAAPVAGEVRARALYYAGRAQQENGKPAAAAKHYQQLAQDYPDSPLAPFGQYQAAFVLLDQGKLEAAAVAFSEVAASDAGDALRTECRFRAAETYDKMGWYSNAVKEYERLRKDFPDSAYARRADYGYAWALYHAGDYGPAAQAAAAFLKSHPDSNHAVGMKYLQGNCLQQEKKYDEAIAAYQAIRKDHPDSEFALRSHYKIAWVLHFQGKQEAARQEALKLLEDPRNETMQGEGAFLLGSIELASGNYEDAYEEFGLVAAKYPDSEFAPEALYKAGECLAQLDKLEEAMQVFRNFVEKYPKHSLAKPAGMRLAEAEQVVSEDPQAAAKRYEEMLATDLEPEFERDTLYRLAIAKHNVGDFAGSAEAFQRLIEKHPKCKYASEAHFRMAEHFLKDQEDPIKAIAAYEAAYKAAPKGEFAGKAVRGAALARYGTKDYAAAADLFLRLMRDYPKVSLNEDAYAWVGQWLFDKGRWDDAATAFRAMLDADPDYPTPERVEFKIAECAEAAGKTDAAIALFTAIVEAAPRSSLANDARYHMAQLRESQEKMDEAKRLYEEAAAFNSGDSAARARFRLGELYEAEEEYAAAARSYMRVVILFLHEELSPEALWRAGRCFERAERIEQAVKTYEELLRDYPDGSHGAQAKERLAALKGG